MRVEDGAAVDGGATVVATGTALADARADALASGTGWRMPGRTLVAATLGVALAAGGAVTVGPFVTVASGSDVMSEWVLPIGDGVLETEPAAGGVVRKIVSSTSPTAPTATNAVPASANGNQERRFGGMLNAPESWASGLNVSAPGATLRVDGGAAGTARGGSAPPATSRWMAST